MSFPRLTTYADAAKLLQGRCYKKRRLDKATILERDPIENQVLYCFFKNEKIVTLYPDGRTVLHGTAHTNSRRFRIERFLPIGFGIWQNRNIVVVNKGNWADGTRYCFADGMVVHPNSTVTGHDPESYEDKLKAYHRASNQRNKMYAVESAEGYTSGDIVFVEFNSYYHWTTKAITPARTEGPFKIRKIMAKLPGSSSKQRVLLWLRDMQDRIPHSTSGKPQWQGVNIRYYKLRRDQFLSAAQQALRQAAKESAVAVTETT